MIHQPSIKSTDVHIRLTPELKKQAMEYAKSQERSLSYITIKALKHYLETEGKNP